MSNLDCLRIANWNGRSVHGKKLEFFDFLERHSIDVGIVTETWLQQKHAFFHPNFSCVRFDRILTNAERGGGVLIAVRKDIRYSELSISTKVIESVGISISTTGGNIHIISFHLFIYSN